MHILYLAHRIPYPPNKGDKIRSYHEVRHLTARHEVDLGCLCDDPEDLKYVETLRTWCRTVRAVPIKPWKCKAKSLVRLAGNAPLSVGYFYDGRLQRWVDEQLAVRKYDAVVCFSSPMAEYLFCSRHVRVLWNLEKAPRKVMDFCDVDSDKWAQYAKEARFPQRWIYEVEARRLLAYEQEVDRRFDASVFITRKEADMFLAQSQGAKPPWIVGNGVATDYFAPARDNGEDFVGEERHPSVVFVGAMDYHANVDGVLWFASRVWPRVREVHPNAEFFIVGSRPVEKVRRLDGIQGIRVTGYVPDVRPFLAKASCSVAPLRLARGIQNKVLEAMAMGKAVVATSQALEGLEAVPGRDVIQVNQSIDFSQAILQIMADSSLRRTFGENARNYVLRHHSWLLEMTKLENILSVATNPCPWNKLPSISSIT